MKANSALKEVLALKLSPVILSGHTSTTKSELSEQLRRHYSSQEYLVLDTVDVVKVADLRTILTLHKSDLRMIVVDASGVTLKAWEKLLKVLEDNAASTQVVIVSDGTIPPAIETRCFKCHIPPKDEVAIDYSGTSAFAVGSWLISVDVRNSEQLLKSCQEWTDEHSQLLMAELNEQLLGGSLLGLSLEKRLSTPNRIMAAIYMLDQYASAPTASLYAGLRLMV